MYKIRPADLLLLAFLTLGSPLTVKGEISVSITIAPPPLPEYVQPVNPEVGYLWTPGYWQWSEGYGYYWVPGTWVQPPTPGLLWTPGYWSWSNGAFLFNQGYWGPHVGYYGGVNYGFGFGGTGFGGGEWRGRQFFYNTAVMNVGSNVTNVYVNRTVVVNRTVTNNYVSYQGGDGGIKSAPNREEQQAAHEHRVQPTAQQTQHQVAASANPQFLAKNNGGKPAIAATQKPSDFSSKNVVPAKAPAGLVNPASQKVTTNAAPKEAAPPPRPMAQKEVTPPPRPVAPKEAAPPPNPVAPREAAPPPRPAAPREAAPPPHPAAPREAAPPARPAPPKEAAPREQNNQKDEH